MNVTSTAELTRAESGAPASGLLRVVRHGRRSVVARAFATSPLRLLTPSNHGDAAWVFTSTYGGGLVGGDAVHLRAEVERGATTLLQTQASTKIYRSPRGASVELEARVGEDARLFVLPDATVCFKGAALAQTQRVDMHDGASLVLMDWLTAGRRAAGERWAFNRYESRLTVFYDRRLVLSDALLLSPEDGPLATRLGRFECLCVIALIGPGVNEHAARASAEIAATEVRTRPDMLVAAAPLDDVGCVIRLAGVSVEEVGRAARAYLSFVPRLLGDDPWARKW